MTYSKKIQELVQALTLEEKVGMIHGNSLFATKGVPRLGIPPLVMSDGPMGVRMDFQPDQWVPAGNDADYVSYLPSGSALASTWNRSLAWEAGRVLGEETRGRGKDVILGPSVNIKRSPLCGRNFEYMSEDPYLAGEQTAPMIRGIQEADVAACVKHFAVNNQETERLYVEAELSDRALRELYLPAFEKAVKEGKSYTLMGAYNKIKGEHCCESQFLLDEILRGEWGYDGVVISDWGAVHNTEKAAACSLDVEMSVTNDFDQYKMADPLLAAVKEGRIREEQIDEKVKRVLLLMERLHMLEGDRKKGCYNTPEHRETAKAAAEEAVVLLKNEGNRLPLKEKKIKKMLVIGENAVHVHSCGGGSAEIKALYEITPLMGLKMYLGGNVQVDYTPGYYVPSAQETQSASWQETSLENGGGQTRDTEMLGTEESQKRREALEEALRLAADERYEEVLFVGGLNHDFDSEGQDRKDMKLPYGQDEVIRKLLEIRPDMTVVMHAGSPVEMEEWADQVSALVWLWYSGMEGGTALAEVLFGAVNPSGHLPETFPKYCEDCPSHSIGEFPGDDTVRHKEEIYVGYRYYQTQGKKPRFCFGHGLSYTTFSYEEVQVSREKEIEVSLKVKNTGSRKGKELIQLYIHPVDNGADRPVQELKGYEKIELDCGEEKNVTFTLSEESFARYDEERKAFVTEPGRYEIWLGESCEKILAKAEVRIG